MFQQPLFVAESQPSAARPKKTTKPAPDPFPTYRETQAAIKELRDQVKQLKKDNAEKTTLNKAAGNQLAKTLKQLTGAQKRNITLARKNAELEARVRMYGDMLYNQMAGQARNAPIPSDILNRLIRLSHPDKHGGSAAANEVTSWLLKQRRS